MPQSACQVSRLEDQGASIEDIRGRIDEIDDRIAELINQRAVCAVQMAAAKQGSGQPVFVPGREDQIIARVCRANPGPMPADGLETVYREIISLCRALQHPLSVAFLGPEFTYSHQVALKRFGSACRFEAQPSLAAVFRAVERGQAQVALVPVENSSEGAVGEVLDRLAKTRVKVCGETYLSIAHALMSREKDLAKIERVYSHPQALAQCRDWLARNLYGAELVPVASTAAAARRAEQDERSAAVGSALLAGSLGLPLLAEGIQDSDLNTTRFLMLSRDDHPRTGADKTSICFIASHRPGSLHRVLGHLAGRGINLTRIESRPVVNRPWEYTFFADMEGHREDQSLAEALQDMRQDVEMFKLLGSYPTATPPCQQGNAITLPRS